MIMHHVESCMYNFQPYITNYIVLNSTLYEICHVYSRLDLNREEPVVITFEHHKDLKGFSIQCPMQPMV